MTSLDVRAIDESELKKTPRPKTKHELQVFLAEEAFDRAVERGTSDTTREIGGVLVGEILRDDSGPYLRIDTTIDALHAEEKGAELTFTHATWEHIHKEMDTTHKGKKVVGWYHTHPGFGVFLSDRDQFIHKSFFNLPFQVALVYDPKSKEHGVFAWRDNEVWRMRRYVIGAREHTWDGNRTTARPIDDKKDDKQKKERDDDDRPQPKDGEEPLLGSFATYALMAVLLALLAGFLGNCYGRGAANEQLLRAQILIEHARGDGAALERAELQGELIDVLRASVDDEAVRQPIAQAVILIEAALKDLEPPAPAAPTVPSPAQPPAAGSATPAPTPTPAPAPPPPRPADPKLATALDRLRQAHDALAGLWNRRAVATNTLDTLERATRDGVEARVSLVHDVSEHRAALGQLYAELATEVAKTDPKRAHNLLAAAAHIDPSNFLRYQSKLESFEKGGKLQRESGDTEKPNGVKP